VNAQILTKDGVTKERLALYPLFDVQFLDWLYAQFPAETLPVYLAHFRFTKPDASNRPYRASLSEKVEAK
jgi:hypothetical protein